MPAGGREEALLKEIGDLFTKNIGAKGEHPVSAVRGGWFYQRVIPVLGRLLAGRGLEEREELLKEVRDFLRDLFSGNVPTCGGGSPRLFWRGRGWYYMRDLEGGEAYLREGFRNYVEENARVWMSLRSAEDGKAERLGAVLSGVLDVVSELEERLIGLLFGGRKALRSGAVISIGHIAGHGGGGLIRQLLSHDGFDKQRAEWEELGILGEGFSRENLLRGAYPNLPLDTAYFPELEERICSLYEDRFNGLLIRADNLCALHKLLHSHADRVKTIYIDPPFNKDYDAGFSYSVEYSDDAWITMLHNRLTLARELLRDDGCIFVRCDHSGNMYVRLLLDEIFGAENFVNELKVRRFRKNVMGKKVRKLPEGLDTIYVYAKDRRRFSYTNPYRKGKKRKGFWRHMGDSSGQGKPKVFFGRVIEPPEGRHWKYSQENIDRMIEEGRLVLVCRSCGYVHGSGLWDGCPRCGEDDPQPRYWVEETDREVLDSNWSDIYGYSKRWGFRTENSEELLRRIIETTTEEGDIVLDFFLGSGTTTAVAHKLGRRWIGVEAGEHFYSVVMKRMKKVLAYDGGGISPAIRERYSPQLAGGAFRYVEYERYEDLVERLC